MTEVSLFVLLYNFSSELYLSQVYRANISFCGYRLLLDLRSRFYCNTSYLNDTVIFRKICFLFFFMTLLQNWGLWQNTNLIQYFSKTHIQSLGMWW